MGKEGSESAPCRNGSGREEPAELRSEGRGAGKVTKKGNQALEIAMGPLRRGGEIQVTNSAVLRRAKAGGP